MTLSSINEEIKRAAELISNADAVVIAAGAGMSIPAGIDYTSEEIFEERYPAMLKYGLRRCYDTFGFSGFRENRALSWGYMCEHGHYSTTFVPTDHTYYTLRRLVGDKPYFVATSNADGLFSRTGFNKERIYTPQGSYDTMQCKNGCGHVFSSLDIIEKVRANTPKDTLILDTSKCPIPTCPKCGNDCCFNLNGGGYYINKHWEKDRKAMQTFINETLASGKKLVIIEVGISVYNTPGVLRYPMEQIVGGTKLASMVRVNPDRRTNRLSGHAGPVEPERFVPLAMSVDKAIAEIAAAAGVATGSDRAMHTEPATGASS